MQLCKSCRVAKQDLDICAPCFRKRMKEREDLFIENSKLTARVRDLEQQLSEKERIINLYRQVSV